MKILIAGGGGYIGSNIAWYLLKGGHVPVVLDNWSAEVSEAISGIDVVPGDAGVMTSAKTAFEHFQFDAMIYAIAPSPVARPLSYKAEQVFPDSVGSAVVLSKLCCDFNVNRIILLSSSSVYGETSEEGAAEDAPLEPLNIIGQAELCNERIFQGYADQGAFSLSILRIFNVAGASFDGKHGEYHNPERHIIPSLLNVIKSDTMFKLWGDKLPTPDGTAVRDFVHVQDVSEAVRLNLEKPFSRKTSIYNICSGCGFSVKQIIKEAEEFTSTEVPVEVMPDSSPRAAFRVGKNTKISNELGWEPKYSSIDEMLRSQWEEKSAGSDKKKLHESPLYESASSELFGEIAIKLGFISKKEVKEALMIQQKDIKAGKPHRLIGLVMLEEGMIDNGQLIELLRYYEQDSK